MENKMAEVAKLLGLKLGEEFKIQGLLLRYRFTNIGLQYYNDTEGGWLTSNNLLSMLLQGELSIIKVEQPILDDIEKKYLSNIIKPFRNKVKWIRKISSPTENYEYIRICYMDHNYTNVINFPDFKVNTMYKGMKQDNIYTLKELGL